MLATDAVTVDSPRIERNLELRDSAVNFLFETMGTGQDGCHARATSSTITSAPNGPCGNFNQTRPRRTGFGQWPVTCSNRGMRARTFGTKLRFAWKLID